MTIRGRTLAIIALLLLCLLAVLVRDFALSVLALGVIFGVAASVLAQKMVLSRVARLSADVSRIGSSGDLSARVAVDGTDELARLAENINKMLAGIEQSQLHNALVEKLEAAREQLSGIIESLPDATFVLDRDKKVIAWNRAIEEMTGLSKSEIIGKGDYKYAVPFYGRPMPVLADLIDADSWEDGPRYEYVQRKDQTLYAEVFAPALYGGKGAYLWITASPIFDSDGNHIGAIESIRDITERKKTEEQLEYLSMHDSLTGLFNRTYFERRMNQLEEGMCRTPVGSVGSISIVLCDVDGLKFVNDTQGHDVGDELLLAAADIVKGVFREVARDGDVLARIDGDEFAILLVNDDVAAAELVSRRIQEAVAEYNKAKPERPLSLSVGFAAACRCSIGPSLDMGNLFREAENNMHREKLHRSQSAHSAIVQIMMKALAARDFITEGHADRLQSLVAAVAAAVGLPEHVISDLRLLAQFHDIGKVGIPDRILLKPGLLTAEEVTEMRRHCEIGHRIARAAPPLAPIADWILRHHEWWNGAGYPLGLKGEEIPLACRILAIADAYDAMTSDRPYRKAMTHEQAVAELKKCAGTQFDPRLVDKFVEVLNRQVRLGTG